MIRLLTELTDKELTRRIHRLEEVHWKIMDELNLPQTQYKRDILFQKREVCLQLYLKAVYEAAYRDLITIH